MSTTENVKTPATAKGEATRAFLLRTAAEVFAARGYAATTQNDLIAASGLTKGAFYFYFPSKTELALAVLRDQQERWLAWVQERVGSSGSAAEQLRVFVPAMLELIAAEPGAWSVTRLSRELSADPALADEVRKPMSAWVGLLADLVRRGQAAGELHSGPDAEAVAVVLVGAFEGLKSLTDVLDPEDRGGESFAARARALFDLVEPALFVDSRA
jgi:AcrR family transcriptional regulator